LPPFTDVVGQVSCVADALEMLWSASFLWAENTARPAALSI